MSLSTVFTRVKHLPGKHPQSSHGRGRGGGGGGGGRGAAAAAIAERAQMSDLAATAPRNKGGPRPLASDPSFQELSNSEQKHISKVRNGAEDKAVKENMVREFSEYVGDAQDQDGVGYWKQFSSPSAAYDDFKLYVEEVL